MALTRIELTKRATDEDGRLIENYTVVGDNTENVETVLTSYGPKGTRLPQRGDVNRIRRQSGNPKDTFVDKSKVTHDAKDWNTYKVTITYTPPEESSESDDPNNVLPDYPWNDPTEMSQTGDIINIAARGTDKAGQKFQYSNGASVVMDVPVPVTNINIVRKPLKSNRNSFELSSEFFQTINNNDVTIDGTNYPKHTLLVQAFDVELARFRETDPVTGVVTLTKYYVENIVLTYNKLKWFEYIVDEGILAKRELDTPDGSVETFIPQTNKYSGNIVTEATYLDGTGKAVFDEEGNVLNPAATSGKTPQGVEISSELSIAGGPEAQCVLVFATYDEKDFGGMDLNEGL